MRYRAILFMICSLLGIDTYLKAEIITYDFSSASNWVTEPNGDSHPNTGTSALLNKIYYKGTNDCFVGKGNVYFSEGYLMLKSDASLQVPHKESWSINKITLHAHSGGSTSVEVNIYREKGGASSTALVWKKTDYDYEYTIIKEHKQSQLYIRTTNSNNARITKVTVDYTPKESTDESLDNSSVSAPIFKPSTSTFSTESLDVVISAAKGCVIYYTTNGTTPSLENLEECSKGSVATFYASDSPITLNAIAVDSISGKYSNVSSATYTYIDPTIKNDGSREKPFSVAEVKQMVADKRNKWVKGVIYGVWVVLNEDISNVVTSGFNSSTNIVIGDELTHIPIRLTDEKSKTIRKEINLEDHPYLIGKEILVNGLLTKCYDSFGVAEVADYEITYDVPINSYGCATLFLDMPVLVPSGSTAYYCTTEGEFVNLLPVEERIIPDSMGVIIKSKPNTTSCLIYTTETNKNEEYYITKNQLTGFTKDTTIVANDNAYYALNAKENKVGFYIPGATTEVGFTAKAHKAYLQVPIEQKAPMYLIHWEDDETRITSPSQAIDEVIYDLLGRKITFLTPGLYIKGGKKIIVR